MAAATALVGFELEIIVIGTKTCPTWPQTSVGVKYGRPSGSLISQLSSWANSWWEFLCVPEVLVVLVVGVVGKKLSVITW